MCTLEAFTARVWEQGAALYRDLPWRGITDPYAVLVSEVMLQQTQVSRVLKYWPRFLEMFPTPDALAAAEPALVLEQWQGLGYNRRALMLHRAAMQCAEQYGGTLPETLDELKTLPGVGDASAAGVMAFAYNMPAVYIETNVRTVFIHEFFADAERVSDRELRPLVEATCPGMASMSADDALVGQERAARAARASQVVQVAQAAQVAQVAQACSVEPSVQVSSMTLGGARVAPARSVRDWYYALLDYGAHLKRSVGNASQRSAAYTRQSSFEGSRRQKRAEMLRYVLAGVHPSIDDLFAHMQAWDVTAGRAPIERELFDDILHAMLAEGFFRCVDDVLMA